MGTYISETTHTVRIIEKTEVRWWGEESYLHITVSTDGEEVYSVIQPFTLFMNEDTPLRAFNDWLNYMHCNKQNYDACWRRQPVKRSRLWRLRMSLSIRLYCGTRRFRRWLKARNEMQSKEENL